MAPEVQKPSKWLCLTKLPREKYSQPIVHKALSWGSIRKSACMLAEITIRKSQELKIWSIFINLPYRQAFYHMSLLSECLLYPFKNLFLSAIFLRVTQNHPALR
jgi:hypothetical protein